MERRIGKRVSTLKFWDGYAKWYKLWMDHTHYHERIIDVMVAMTKRGWKVLDIGAGSGVLSIPLHARGCEVTALEPSSGMRNLLSQQAFKNGIDRLIVDDRIWEGVPCDDYLDYDLILACNTLHLTEIGFEEALAKVFRARPKNVFLISEVKPPEIRVTWSYGNYRMVFIKFYEVDSSYAYHHLNEVVKHWAFKKGRALQPDDIQALEEMMVVQNGHLWIPDQAQVMMCWWKMDGQKRGS